MAVGLGFLSLDCCDFGGKVCGKWVGHWRRFRSFLCNLKKVRDRLEG